MKKNLVLAAFSLLVFAFSASAQKATDFSGTWNLDLSKSTLSDRDKASIQSQTLTVTQTAANITVTTATQRNAPPAGAPAGGPPGGGRMGGGDGTATYTLDGKETKTEMDGPMGKTPVSYWAKVDGAKLELSSARTFTGQMGEMKISTKDSWDLSADGKTLTVNRQMESPRGVSSSTFVFSKK